MNAWRGLIVLVVLLAGLQAEAALSVARFGQVGPGVFRGSRPTSREDFAFLRKLGIKTIVSLELFPFHVIPERNAAAAAGFRFFNVPLNASPIPPTEEHVNQALDLLHDPANQPVYVHCLLGRDRTSMVAGLYQIYFMGISSETAYKEQFEHYGELANFPGLYGIRYYWEHHDDLKLRWRHRHGD